MAVRLAYESYPEEAGEMVGTAMGQAMLDRQREESIEQPAGEWRTHEVDGYHFSIRRTDSGNLEVQRE